MLYYTFMVPHTNHARGVRVQVDTVDNIHDTSSTSIFFNNVT